MGGDSGAVAGKTQMFFRRGFDINLIGRDFQRVGDIVYHSGFISGDFRTLGDYCSVEIRDGVTGAG